MGLGRASARLELTVGRSGGAAALERSNWSSSSRPTWESGVYRVRSRRRRLSAPNILDVGDAMGRASSFWGGTARLLEPLALIASGGVRKEKTDWRVCRPVLTARSHLWPCAAGAAGFGVFSRKRHLWNGSHRVLLFLIGLLAESGPSGESSSCASFCNVGGIGGTFAAPDQRSCLCVNVRERGPSGRPASMPRFKDGADSDGPAASSLGLAAAAADVGQSICVRFVRPSGRRPVFRPARRPSDRFLGSSFISATRAAPVHVFVVNFQGDSTRSDRDPTTTTPFCNRSPSTATRRPTVGRLVSVCPGPESSPFTSPARSLLASTFPAFADDAFDLSPVERAAPRTVD